MSTEHLVDGVGQVLTALMGADNKARQEAELYLRSTTVQQPGDVLLVLAQIGALGVGGFQLDHRFLSLILLRRLAFRDLPGLFLNQQARNITCPFDVVAERTRSRVEQVLCVGLKDEVDMRMRKVLGTCAAGWAEESAKRQRPFLSLPPVLLELVAAREPFRRFTPFQLLDLCPTLLVDSVQEPIPPDQLAQLLVAGLKDPSVDVRVEAVKAVRSVIGSGLTASERDQIGGRLVFEAFNTASTLPPDLMQHALTPLLDLAERYSSLLMAHRAKLLPFCLELLSPPEPTPLSPYKPGSDSWSDVAPAAAGILLALIESWTNEVVAWERGRAVRELVPLLIAWEVVQAEDEDDAPTDFLRRLFDAYAAFEAVTLVLPTLMQHPDWRYPYAGLRLVGIAAEYLESSRLLTVRHAFLMAVRDLSWYCDVKSDIAPMLQDPDETVRTGAAETIGAMDEIEPSMAPALLAAFRTGPVEVQEAVLKAIAAVAPKECYSMFMPLCIEVVGYPDAKLVAAAADCACTLALVVGKQEFAGDALPLANAMLRAQNEAKDPTTLMDSWVLFCRAVKEDFEPFLPQVMPPLLAAASYKPTPQRAPGLSEDEPEEDGVHTSELEDKAMAFDDLAAYASVLGSRFAPWVPQVMQLALEGLDQGEEVAEAAPYLITSLLRSAKDGDAPVDLNDVFTKLINAMVKADMYTEEALFLKCFADAVKIVAQPLPPNILHHFSRSVDGILQDLELQRENRLQQVGWMDDAEKKEEEEVEEEEQACLKVMRDALDGVAESNGNVEELIARADAVAQRRMR
ncbi:hypothetical protein EHS25_002973 [Saitozyma podzolica]|uniref:Uncharacterized protein n=1 Tax=Saitozyma podzolica TaxID=1890683 RepID=A0A427YC87_9TREE|nr:hypothetical protein EHS25_002973 [Saitozyma podzolica]